MLYLILLLASVSCLVAGDCEDLVSKNNRLIIRLKDKNITMTSCRKAVKNYPGVCESIGVDGGLCCASCSDIGTPDCLDKASRKQKLQVTINGKSYKVKSCAKQMLLESLMPLCSPDAFGGKYGSCCQTCKDTCVDAITWKLINKSCKDCNCAVIKNIPGLMDKCCEKNWKGVGADGKKHRCRDMCCASCSAMP